MMLLTPSAARTTSASTVNGSPFRGLALNEGLGEKESISSTVVEKRNLMLSCFLHPSKRQPTMICGPPYVGSRS